MTTTPEHETEALAREWSTESRWKGVARDYGPDELVGVPEEAAELLAEQLESGDRILVKGSRSAGLEAVAETLEELLDG